MKKTSKLFTIATLCAALLLTNTHVTEARAVYTESGSYVDANGCIHITYNVQHRFLGINWYSTTEDVTSIC